MTRHRLTLDDDVSKRVQRQAKRLGETPAWILEVSYLMAEKFLDQQPSLDTKAGRKAYVERMKAAAKLRLERKA